MSFVRLAVLCTALSIPFQSVSADKQLQEVPGELALGLSHYEYGAASIENESPEISIGHTRLKLPMGRHTAFQQTLIPSLVLERTAFDVTNDNNAAADPELFALKIQFMFVSRQSGKWTRILQLTPSIHTDGEATDSDALSLMGLAIWRYKANAQKGWSLGIGANRTFGEFQPVPFVTYHYSPDSRTKIDLGFPKTRLEHRWHDRWTAFASVEPQGGNWRYDSDFAGEVNVSYSSWLTSAGLRYEIQPKIWLTLAAGQALARVFNIDDDDDSTEVDIEDGSMFMLSIGMHP